MKKVEPSGHAWGIARRSVAFLATLSLTFLGLTAVTFTISRLTKIDPVLAIVGDKASKAVYDKTLITSKGYDTGDGECNPINPDRLEREIITNY